VSARREITRRDLRDRSQEIMDAVEDGQAFTLTKDGREIGELIPICCRRLVPREDFATASSHASAIDPAAFRADQNAAADHGATP
jgi:prevent-host-death family protein